MQGSVAGSAQELGGTTGNNRGYVLVPNMFFAASRSRS